MGYIGLSREEAIRKHRKLWGWIAAETRRLKRCVKKNEFFWSTGLRIRTYRKTAVFVVSMLMSSLKKREVRIVIYVSIALLTGKAIPYIIRVSTPLQITTTESYPDYTDSGAHISKKATGKTLPLQLKSSPG